MPRTNSRMKTRVVEVREPAENFYIFCEGEKTEPQYFESMKSIIASEPMYKNMIYIKGLGKNTTGVLQYAIDYVNEHKITNGQIWCVYDKDDFPSQSFNEVEYRIDRLNEDMSEKQGSLQYHAAWSNQCIEYWFLLHFEFYQTDGSRADYMRKLSEHFGEKQCGKYEKNSDTIFETLTWNGKPKQAIKWARRRLDQFVGKTPTESVPATKVHELVKNLTKYFPEAYRTQYI